MKLFDGNPGRRAGGEAGWTSSGQREGPRREGGVEMEIRGSRGSRRWRNGQKGERDRGEEGRECKKPAGVCKREIGLGRNRAIEGEIE